MKINKFLEKFLIIISVIPFILAFSFLFLNDLGGCVYDGGGITSYLEYCEKNFMEKIVEILESVLFYVFLLSFIWYPVFLTFLITFFRKDLNKIKEHNLSLINILKYLSFYSLTFYMIVLLIFLIVLTF